MDGVKKGLWGRSGVLDFWFPTCDWTPRSDNGFPGRRHVVEKDKTNQSQTYKGQELIRVIGNETTWLNLCHQRGIDTDTPNTGFWRSLTTFETYHVLGYIRYERRYCFKFHI